MNLSAAIAAAAPNLSSHDVNMWALAFAPPITRYGLTSPYRTAGLIGQCAVESEGFLELIEDMSYTANGILRTWPSRFANLTAAIPYARNPEKLGNHVYAGRMGNGDEASGDGYRYRGVGPIQTTGKDALTDFAKACGRTPADAALWAQTPAGGADLACYDWMQMACNQFADVWALSALSARINGTNPALALADRVTACNAALKALGVSSPHAVAVAAPVTVTPVSDADQLMNRYNPGVPL